MIEFKGGPITHRYLMNKSKDELASMVREYINAYEARMQFIREVCTGERQVAEDDTEALQYIVEYIDKCRE